MQFVPKLCRLGAALLVLLGCGCGLTSPSGDDGFDAVTGDAECTEGDGCATLTLTLSPAPSSQVTFEVDTHDGTATAPGDYTETHADLVVPADSTSVAIEIPIAEDGVIEVDEWFTVTLQPACRAAAPACTALVTIHEKYPVRTSPDRALEQLALAYDSMNAAVYLDVLAGAMEFHLCQDDWQGGVLPESWGKSEETTIHENMFSPDGDVEWIQLTLETVSSAFDPGANPADPADDRWEYTEDFELWLTVGGDLAYLARGTCEFHFQRDADDLGPSGEELWEIIDWYELDSYRVVERSVGGHVRGEQASWGSVKALFR